MKSFVRHSVVLTLCTLIVLGMTGCPTRSVLGVQPRSLTLSDTKTDATVIISNDGSGTLKWTAQVSVPWLVLALEGDEERSQSITASTKETDLLVLYLNKELLPDQTDQLSATVSIDSNGGAHEVTVAIQRIRTPRLLVEPVSLDFGDTEDELLVEILNQGDGVLEWEINIPEGVDWISADPEGGSVLYNAASAVTIRINRARLVPSLTPYTLALDVLSNGGEDAIAVTALATAFSATPSIIDFGMLAQQGTGLATLETLSAEAVPLAISVSDGAAWLALSSELVNVTRASSYDLRITADPVGLVPGDYTATVSIFNEATEQLSTVQVTMAVGAPASFHITPAILDFGESREEAVQLEATLINDGVDPLDWRIEKPDTAVWIDISQEAGVLADSVPLTFTTSPLNLSPGTYSANLSVYAGGVSSILRVLLVRPEDPMPNKLQVEPTNLDFGSQLNQLDINVWNEGPDSIDWSIDGDALPEWLQIEPLSGTVGGDVTQLIRVRPDRDLLPEDEDIVIGIVEVNSSVAGDDPVEVSISVQPRYFPQIEIVGQSTDEAGNASIALGLSGNSYIDSETFIIRNNGTDDVEWSIVLGSMPAWITSIDPSEGVVSPGREMTVTVITDSSTVGQNGDSFELRIESNDPGLRYASLFIRISRPVLMIIDSCPFRGIAKLDFGNRDSVRNIALANWGDEDSLLEFIITTNYPGWVFIDPPQASSIGDPIWGSDCKSFAVAIDRNKADENARVILTVEAVNLQDDALPVEPYEIEITFAVPDLTLETSGINIPGTPPSIVRFNMLPRDRVLNTFPGLEDDYSDNRTKYRVDTVKGRVLEKGQDIEYAETNIFVKKNEYLQFSVMVMLDYSASMAEVAQALVDDGQLDPGGREPLDALYIQTVGPMLQEFSPHYNVALAVFNERRFNSATSSLRIITGAPTPDNLFVDRELVKSKDILQYRIENTNVVEYGATPLQCAIIDAALNLNTFDVVRPDYEGDGEKILVVITDGRVTTPPGESGNALCKEKEVQDILAATRVRFCPVGFGKQVRVPALIKFSQESGGHYYRTDSAIIEGSFDNEGNPMELPVLESLLNVCRADPANEGARSLPKDLRSHVIVRYITLNEESSDISADVRLKMNEIEPPVTGTYGFKFNPWNRTGDVRLGQISSRTEGVQPDGTAMVQVYSSYMPRNITRLQFKITTVPDLPWTVVKTDNDNGGLVGSGDWSLTADPATGIITLEVASPATPLLYGDWGSLVDITFTGIAVDSFVFDFEMLAPYYDPDSPDGKFFAYINWLEVGAELRSETFYPHPVRVFTPKFDSPETRRIITDSLEEPVRLDILNIGFEHLKFDRLLWKVVFTGGGAPDTTPVTAVFDYYQQYSSLGLSYPSIDPYDADDYFYIPAYYDEPPLPVGRANSGLFTPTIPLDGGGNPEPGRYSVEFYVDGGYVDSYSFVGSEAVFHRNFYGPYYLIYDVN